MRVLVTGASGFIGSAIIRQLLKTSHRPVALLLPNDPAPGLTDLTLEKKNGDLFDPASLTEALHGCEAVIHAAGKVNFKSVGRRSAQRINVEGTARIVSAARAGGIGKLILVSSLGALGGRFKPEPLTETAPGEPIAHHYHADKRAAEAALRREAGDKLAWVMVLPAMVWGPGDRNRSSTGAVLTAKHFRRVFYTAPGGASVIDVEDVARGTVAVLERGRPGEQYILAGENLTFEAIGRSLAEALGPGVRCERMSLTWMRTLGWVAEAMGTLGLDLDFSMDVVNAASAYWWADGTKAWNELGFTPKYSGREAIWRTVEWYREHEEELMKKN